MNDFKSQEQVQRNSLSPLKDRIEKLKELAPEAFVEGKVDFDKFREVVGEFVDDRPERYSFTWAGKRDAIRMLQVPAQGTFVPCPDESVEWESTKNIFIEGENLETLKLLYKSYFGQVKMIYIDPPYNTGNDFVYPDNFTDPLANYLKITGQKNGNGDLLTSNPDTNGRYHSTWLSMMYPRLFVARQLLREDGVIFVSIDDHEVYNLRMVMNEIFGEENLIAQFIWKSRQNKDNRNVTNVSIDHEYILCYGKCVRGSSRDLSQYSNPDDDSRGPWASGNMVGLLPEDQRPELHYDLIDPDTGINYGKPSMGWRYDKNTMKRLIEEKRILWPGSPSGRPRRKVFLNELKDNYTGYSSVIGEDIYTRDGTQEIETLFGKRVIEFPKPSDLIKDLIEQGTNESNCIVLDFFSGSSTTAHAVLALNWQDGKNRRFIMVQIPEFVKPGSAADKTGFNTISEIGKERIRLASTQIKHNENPQLSLNHARSEELDLGFRVYKLSSSNFRPWKGIENQEPDAYIQQMSLYTDPFMDGWTIEKIIAEVALKEAGFSLSYRVENLDIPGKQTVYKVNDPDKEQFFYICLDSKMYLEEIKSLQLTKDTLFICRDVALNDETAANLALQCRLKTL